MKIWIVAVTTESADHYYFAYKTKPNRDDIVEQIWEMEGKGYSLKWYLDTTWVMIEETELRD